MVTVQINFMKQFEFCVYLEDSTCSDCSAVDQILIESEEKFII